eukprot:11834619-Ditylum_brightwellii.AAC.1
MGIGYYGWVVATVCNILTEAKGHATGPKYPMESLRTESTSILSLLCFLLHSTRYYNLCLNANTWIQYCNNSTAVKRMKWITLCMILKPNTTLTADYDIQLQIEEIIQQLNILWHTEHVKGHQTGQNLPWEA